MPPVTPAPDLSDVPPVAAACLPVVVAPFGYLLGWLFVVHLVPSETTAVWLTTTALTSLSFLAYGVSVDGRED